MEAFRTSRLVASRSTTACEIEVLTGDGTPCVGVQKKCVGEKVTLEARCKNGGTSTLRDVQWTIPGTIVSNYEDDQERAQVTQFKEQDKKKAQIAFYWVDGKDRRPVGVACICTCSGTGIKGKLTLEFNVKAPRLVRFVSTTTKIDFTVQTARGKSATELTFGGPGANGITWEWTVTVPDLVDGELKDVQLIKTRRELITAGQKKLILRFPNSRLPPREYFLDNENPYWSKNYIENVDLTTQQKVLLKKREASTIGFPQDVSKGQSFTENLASDRPGYRLLDGPVIGLGRDSFTSEMSDGDLRQMVDALEFDDQFKYYIMYKPKTAEAIWVPVAVAEWYYHFKAEFDAQTGEWSLPVAKHSKNPSGKETTEFPLYEHEAKKSLRWGPL